MAVAAGLAAVVVVVAVADRNVVQTVACPGRGLKGLDDPVVRLDPSSLRPNWRLAERERQYGSRDHVSGGMDQATSGMTFSSRVNECNSLSCIPNSCMMLVRKFVGRRLSSALREASALFAGV